ncbi:hypothetical protein [Frigoriglobus tundricola]|uniref:DUF4279 domain-containing protein n=1 Tax=Frigoriglobus tundricola TaxID=2774151 RepID=A0A6M5YNN9_9BACT|nr:hypothetical protein [Frigoriglobus tundricola]QJW95568.1 hypothetical protein FTUN_3118 [Frigoriglobus tundricola]
MTTPIRYINTDLDLVASYDLGALARALEARDVFALHVTSGDDGSCSARFELNTFADDPGDNLEQTISKILDAIESFDVSIQSLWLGCSLREFDIGYECGTEPWAFNNELTNHTLLRMARVGTSLRITLYPPTPNAAPSTGA